MKRILSLLLAVLLLALCLSGCSGADMNWLIRRLDPEAVSEEDPQEDPEEEEDPAPTDTNTLIETAEELTEFGLAYQKIFGVHPYNCISTNNRVILSFVYESLFVVDSSFHPQPVLAESWEVSDDGRTTTVHLHENVLFHNGNPMTAADVIYSLQQSVGSEYYGSRLRCIAGMTAVDDHTVQLTTSTAYESLPLLLDIPIIPNGSADKHLPSGTGPYQFVGEARLVRNPVWWQDAEPLVDYPFIRLISVDTSTELRDSFEYENVNLVLTDPYSPAAADFHNDYELWSEPTTVMQYIGYNLNSNVFSNYGLRGAITYAIDRERIVAEEGGFALPVTLPASPMTDYYDVKLASAYGLSSEKFRQRLEDASVKDMDEDGILDLYVPSLGYAVPVSGTMIVNSASRQRVRSAQTVVDTLNSLGFDLTLRELDESSFRTALREGNYDLYYGEVRLSANFDLSPFFRSGGALAYGALSDGVMENLCNQALANSGNTYNLYQRLCDRGYLTPILFRTYAVSATRGAVTDPAGYLDWFLPAPTPEES